MTDRFVDFLDKRDIISQFDVSNELQLQCSVCYSSDIYAVLPTCLHLTCRNCLESVQNDDLYCCPTCKECSDKVICNPNLTASDSSTKLPCTWCEDNGEHTKSIGHCDDCNISLCAECLKGHNRMPPLRNHTIVMSQKNEQQSTLRCESHPNELLECYCESCGVLTCRDCQLSVHRDHGSHKWVGEKAELMKVFMEDAIKHLQEFQSKLTFFQNFVHKAKVDSSNEGLSASIDKTRQDIQSRADLLTSALKNRTQVLLDELDDKRNLSFSKLTNTETLIQNLQTQLAHTVLFTNQLTQNVDNDPATLVQLYDIVKTRVALLQHRAKQIIEDKPMETDEDSQSNLTIFDESRKNTLGWSKIVRSRALFLGNLNATDLCQLSGSVVWLPKQTKETRNGLGVGLIKSCSQIADVSFEEDNDFLDSLAQLDTRNCNSNSTEPSNACSRVGCAVCFGVGLLAYCTKCHRAYHPDCHLPSLDEASITMEWNCSLCTEEIIANASDSIRKDILIGCSLLLGLLVHPEAIYFFASVCPICSTSLLNYDKTSDDSCTVGILYHRLAELRRKLDKNGSTDSGDDAFELNLELSFNLKNWIMDVDKFLMDVTNEVNTKGTTKGCVRAAQHLRLHFNNAVRNHIPQFDFSLPDSVCVEMDTDVMSKFNSSSLSPENGEFDLCITMPSMTSLESH